MLEEGPFDGAPLRWTTPRRSPEPPGRSETHVCTHPPGRIAARGFSRVSRSRSSPAESPWAVEESPWSVVECKLEGPAVTCSANWAARAILEPTWLRTDDDEDDDDDADDDDG